MKRANPFRGRWRIVSTSLWEAQDLDDLGPAQITFGASQYGEFNLVAVSGSLDYRTGTRDGAPIVEFSWEGDDDGQPASGRGWARLDGRGLVGRLFIHQGDETAFVAKRRPTR